MEGRRGLPIREASAFSDTAVPVLPETALGRPAVTPMPVAAAVAVDDACFSLLSFGPPPAVAPPTAAAAAAPLAVAARAWPDPALEPVATLGLLPERGVLFDVLRLAFFDDAFAPGFFGVSGFALAAVGVDVRDFGCACALCGFDSPSEGRFSVRPRL